MAGNFRPEMFRKFVKIQGLAFDYIWSLDLRVPKRTMNLKGCSNISGTAHSANAVLGPPAGLPPARLFHAPPTSSRFLSCPWAPPLEPGRGAGEVTGGRLVTSIARCRDRADDLVSVPERNPVCVWGLLGTSARLQTPDRPTLAQLLQLKDGGVSFVGSVFSRFPSRSRAGRKAQGKT